MYRLFGKRTLDILISVVGIPFFCIIFITVAPIIFFEDRGPIFYFADRLGKDGKTYKMFKFRSMKVNAEDIRNADGSTYNSIDDFRVTKIGKFMRKTSLDETPQILNVLIGNMSLIGPRAFLATGKMNFEEMDAKRRKRLTIRPGITGYSQAYYRNSIGLDQKIEYDCYYVDHMSFCMDIKILFKTVVSVLKHENIYVTSENIKSEK